MIFFNKDIKIKLLILGLSLISSIFSTQAQDKIEPKDIFRYDSITGIGYEKGVTRRDPSDIIKVDGVYYVYYTKVIGRSSGYWGDIWYATSVDEGFSWEEQGQALGKGHLGDFDSQAVFTPNIIFAHNKYYLFYTAVKPTPGNLDMEFENNSSTDITAIGLAVSKSPSGPFERLSAEPILKVSTEPEKFDSYRIDDASLLYRNGLYWLYYKGRSRVHAETGPAHTQMGVAYAQSPEGPYTKFNRPLLDKSHEVLIWPFKNGVNALASISSQIKYAPDGINFDSKNEGYKVKSRPNAPGAFRPDLTNSVVVGEKLSWGIGMVHNGNDAYLIRFDTILLPFEKINFSK
ncbi:glycoside hydrolase family protein [Echinicola shivajiensis]|uniref:hypothetical protein n=1 Tax=Echinicola shivajiensis TaxID=1035916 RepID=UPI001BFC1458|nr:hypothetical protein [Echinicola shivajiensis]